MRNRIKVLLVLVLAPLAAISVANAAEPGMQAVQQVQYEQMIRTAWPHVTLRPEQRSWLAQRSSVAEQECQLSGHAPSWCRELVKQGLREMIGEEPVESGLASSL